MFRFIILCGTHAEVIPKNDLEISLTSPQRLVFFLHNIFFA